MKNEKFLFQEWGLGCQIDGEKLERLGLFDEVLIEILFYQRGNKLTGKSRKVLMNNKKNISGAWSRELYLQWEEDMQY